MKLLLPLADFDVVRNMGNRFHGKQAQLDTRDLFMLLGILTAVCMIAWLLHRFAERQEKRRRYNSPNGLFRELCKAHALTRRERRMLRRLAKPLKLDQPARIFLERQRFDAESLNPSLRAHAADYARLAERLFAGAELAPATNARVNDADRRLIEPAAEQAPTGR